MNKSQTTYAESAAAAREEAMRTGKCVTIKCAPRSTPKSKEVVATRSGESRSDYMSRCMHLAKQTNARIGVDYKPC